MAFTPTHDERGVHVEFGPEFRYLYKAFTLPEYRGRHALRLFKSLRDDYCVQRGRSSAITFIAIDNDPSMKAAYGTGNQRIGFAGFIKLGPAFFTFRSARVRAVGFRFFTPGTRPAPPQRRPDMMPSP